MPLAASLSSIPNVWRADRLARPVRPVVPSGHAALDAELPGGGWPLGALIELRSPTATVPWSPLLLPALAAQIRQRGGVLALVHPPCVPYAPAFIAAGVPAHRMLWLRGRTQRDALWLTEQALGCADVAAVVAWLPAARIGHGQRLGQAAARAGNSLLFVFGPDSAMHPVACAPLRLQLALGYPPAATGLPHRSSLRVLLLKRQGPPLDTPIWLPSTSPALHAVLHVPRHATRRPALALVPPVPKNSNGHALGCTAVAAR